MLRRAALTFLLTLPAYSPLLAGEHDWPRFRGPGGRGLAEGSGLPIQWSRTENVHWVAEVTGTGWSSPIVVRRRVFVTAATSEGPLKPHRKGIYGSKDYEELIERGVPEPEALARIMKRDTVPTDSRSSIHHWMIYCLDAESGALLWQREAHRGPPLGGGRHIKNTYASETPVSDGERIYAYFGNVGLFCYTLQGERLWTRNWDPLPTTLNFGTGASPALHGDRIYVLNDNETRPFLTALDKHTGEVLWRVDREIGFDGRRTGWSTPFIWEHAERTEIVTVGVQRALGYDTSGKVLWVLDGLSLESIPTPFAAEGLLYIFSGRPGDPRRPIFALRPGAYGEILPTGQGAPDSAVAWSAPRGAPYVPTPLVYEGRLYVLEDKGILSVYDARNGEGIYRERISPEAAAFSASPWAYGGKIFCLSEDGDTFVVAAGDEFDLIAKNPLGEMSLATPAVAGSSLFIRTESRLYCLRNASGREDRTPRQGE